MIRIFLFIIITLQFFSGCCSVSQTHNNLLNISVNHSGIYCWLNLMPGGKPTFHISGNLAIKNEETFKIKKIGLKEIILLQDDNPIYKFNPLFEPVNEDTSDKELKIEETKDFHIGLRSGLSIATELDSERPINAKLFFVSDEKTFEYNILNIRIEKAY